MIQPVPKPGDILACRNCKQELHLVKRQPGKREYLDKDHIIPISDEIPMPGWGLYGECFYCKTSFNNPDNGLVEIVLRQKDRVA